MASTLEDDNNLMEMLWQEGSVPLSLLQPDRSTVREEEEEGTAEVTTSNQLFMEEDELRRLLLQYQIEDGGASGSGDGNIYSELLETPPSTDNSSSRPMPVLAKLTPTEKRDAVGKVVESADCRKRKARDDDHDAHTTSVETENKGKKKAKETQQQQQQHPASSTRTRAVEMHNLSERRRRDRINEKMKILQELIPRCNKSDKASMLDDAIEYMKTLKLQVQMMSSMQYTGPWMLPDSPRYLATMGFPNMEMCMNMGMQQQGLHFCHPPPPHPLPLAPSFPSANIAYASQVRAQVANQVQDPTFKRVAGDV